MKLNKNNTIIIFWCMLISISLTLGIGVLIYTIKNDKEIKVLSNNYPVSYTEQQKNDIRFEIERTSLGAPTTPTILFESFLTNTNLSVQIEYPPHALLTNDDIEIHVMSTEYGLGIWEDDSHKPKFEEISHPILGKLYRIWNIDEFMYKEFMNKYNPNRTKQLYTYSSAIYSGSDCPQWIFCASADFRLKNERVVIYCFTKNEADVAICDEFVTNLKLTLGEIKEATH